MPSKTIFPTRVAGRFAQHVSGLIGGTRRSYLVEELPLFAGPAIMRQYLYIANDFLGDSDFDTRLFEWNHVDGSASAYGATTAIAHIPDWLISEIGSASGDPAALPYSSATLRTDTAGGVLRVIAGGTDSTGVQVARSPSGANVANLLPIDQSGTIACGETRFRLSENGTANQSAIALAWSRDEAAILTTAGAQAGTVSQFGLFKALGSASLTAYFRTTTTTTNTVTAGTIVPGTGGADGTWVNFGWRYKDDGTTGRMEVYFNGTLIGTVSNSAATNRISADNYAPTFAVVNGVGCDATLDIDYYWALTARPA